MTFQLIENRLRQLGIEYGRIMGTTYQINKTIENFKNAKVNIQIEQFDTKYSRQAAVTIR